MNKEDRLLLNDLNQAIARYPRLSTCRLSFRYQRPQREPLLRNWLMGFCCGTVVAAIGFAFCSVTPSPEVGNSAEHPSQSSLSAQNSEL